MRQTIFIFSLLLLPIFGANSASASYVDGQSELEKTRTASVSFENTIGNLDRQPNSAPLPLTAKLKQMAKTASMQLYNIGAMAYIIEGRFDDIMKNGPLFEKSVVTLTIFSGVTLCV